MSIPHTLTQGIGYSGKMAAKCYVAKIVGTDMVYGLAREFVEAGKVERDSFTKRRYIRTYHYDIGEGLYEISSHGDRSYGFVFEKNGVSRWQAIGIDRVEKMARLMTAGHDFEAARLATAPATAPEVQA